MKDQGSGEKKQPQITICDLLQVLRKKNLNSKYSTQVSNCQTTVFKLQIFINWNNVHNKVANAFSNTST